MKETLLIFAILIDTFALGICAHEASIGPVIDYRGDINLNHLFDYSPLVGIFLLRVPFVIGFFFYHFYIEKRNVSVSGYIFLTLMFFIIFAAAIGPITLAVSSDLFGLLMTLIPPTFAFIALYKNKKLLEKYFGEI